MIEAEKIKNIAKKADLGKEFVVIDVESRPNNSFTVFIDSLNNITIGDCVKVSRFIEENLDRNIEDYDLSVSSAGIDRPLTTEIQFQKNIGKNVQITLNDNKVVEGKLIEYNKDHIIISNNKKERNATTKKNEIVTINTKIEFNKIKTVTIIISFK